MEVSLLHAANTTLALTLIEHVHASRTLSSKAIERPALSLKGIDDV